MSLPRHSLGRVPSSSSTRFNPPNLTNREIVGGARSSRPQPYIRVSHAGDSHAPRPTSSSAGLTSVGSNQGTSAAMDCSSNKDEDGDVQIVPDGSKDIKQISSMRFIEIFMSGKLVFPHDPKKEYQFGVADLVDMGEIGQGRYGRVIKMLHRQTGMTMAVKLIRLLSTPSDSEVEESKEMRQLQKEVKTIQDASMCPEVVSFYGLTFHEGDCLLCMELMDTSLERLYKLVHNKARERFDETVFGIIAVSILHALNNLKELKRIIHRDVKPSNILLNLGGQIKLCDFGISGYLENSMVKTRGVGCRPYMAPEVLMATQENYDIRCDVWSLGITLIEILRGEFPYPNFNNMCIFDQLRQVVCGDPLFLNPCDQYSTNTVQFVNLCLTKDYDDRPTYENLMNTDFYQYFSSIEGKEERVGAYVQRMLSIAARPAQE